MKRITVSLFILFLLLLHGGYIATAGGNRITRSRITSLANEFRGNKDFNVINVGSLGTSVIKTAVRTNLKKESRKDPEAAQVLKMINGIKNICIIEYDDCTIGVKDRFNSKVSALLDDSQMLMQARDDGDNVNIYGAVSDDSDKVTDLILYVPSDNTLICLFGTISVDAVMKLANSGK